MNIKKKKKRNLMMVLSEGKLQEELVLNELMCHLFEDIDLLSFPLSDEMIFSTMNRMSCLVRRG